MVIQAIRQNYATGQIMLKGDKQYMTLSVVTAFTSLLLKNVRKVTEQTFKFHLGHQDLMGSSRSFPPEWSFVTVAMPHKQTSKMVDIRHGNPFALKHQ